MSDLTVIMLALAIAGAFVYYLFRRQKTPVRKIPHEYFNRLWIWPPGSHTRWEAELNLTIPGIDKKVGLHAEATHEDVTAEGPTTEELAFCKARIANLDELFQIAKPAIEEAWHAWVKKDMPDNWREELLLDGISIPKNGDIKQPWGITYFCKPA